MIKQSNKMEFIDLDLPSGLKWGKCNVGAEKETEWGVYFMWGSTTPNTVSECTWANAPFNNGSSNYDSIYFNSVKDTVCPKGVLVKEYDVATQIMGGEWRMPTQTECQELLDYTNHEWVENFNGSGVNGRKFTSKTDESKYIFIPASGSRLGSSFYGQGIGGYVWSSSLDAEDNGCAWDLHFDSDNISGIYYNFYRNRYRGYAVRGVMD